VAILKTAISYYKRYDTLQARKVLTILFFVGLFAGYSFICLKRETVSNPDFLGFAARANAFGSAPWDSILVNGLYPFGYPLLLRFVFALTHNYHLAGLVISCAAGVATAALFFRIIRLHLPFYEALVATACLASNLFFIRHSTIAGTDMAGVAFNMLAIWFFLSYKDISSTWFYTGVFIALAYLIRYTSLLTFAGFGLYWAYMSCIEKRLNLAQIVRLTLGFLIGSLPQTIPSLLYEHNPFYNTQHWNLYLALLKNPDEIWKVTALAPHFKNAKEVLDAAGPQAFLQNYSKNIGAFATENFFHIHLYFIGLIGIVLAFSKKFTPGILLGCVALVWMAGLSITFLTERIVLMLLPIEVYALFSLVFFISRWGQKASYAMACILALVFVKSFADTPRAQTLEINSAVNAPNREFQKALTAAGITNSAQVLSFSYFFYAVGDPLCSTYATPWKFTDVPIESEPELVWLAVSGGYKILVLHTPEYGLLNGKFASFSTDTLQQSLPLFYTNSNSVFAYQVPETLSKKYTKATEADWVQFASKHYPRLEKSWETVKDVVQEKTDHTPTLQGLPYPKVLAAWRRHKGLHQLL